MGIAGVGAGVGRKIGSGVVAAAIATVSFHSEGAFRLYGTLGRGKGVKRRRRASGKLPW